MSLVVSCLHRYKYITENYKKEAYSLLCNKLIILCQNMLDFMTRSQQFQNYYTVNVITNNNATFRNIEADVTT